MFGRKSRKPPKATVLVPLYIYPDPLAWDPLFAAVANNSAVNFTVIINPNSGPGVPGLDANYTRDIPRLNAYPNVLTVGYVSTNYTNRDLSLIFDDIDTYVSWSQNVSTKGLGMRGIFLDETPNQWTPAAGQFYDSIATVIRSSTGLGADPLIIHNPGSIPDPQFLTSSSANVTVVFEGSYTSYQQYSSSKSIGAVQKSAKVKREQLAAIVYDFPDGEDTKGFLEDLRRRVGNLFITGDGVDGDVYAGWWDEWEGWVGNMSTL
ncbi:uncharacterized protein LY89DRAFT_644923 [Mollisia scopiformis]|uniref:Uncharacterized protein n=1 Tax=Mollisia scopiformis TaxID=149040 RepID=A0A194XBB1_MOLSC|nr:uncharacterized protein LY89DRAFT_644923 [Mollisia scopiformis]KUJ17439.1 hypothetical protein LY89DRAFT_644923 [Mollisia scopiformis]